VSAFLVERGREANYPAAAVDQPLDQLTTIIVGALHADPKLWLALGFAAIVLLIVLQRKPRIQRDADDRLAALRRDKAERDGRSKK
jgi:hypothetical protein